MAPSTASNRSFHSAGFQKLVIGRTISPKPEGNRGVPQVKSSKWHLPPGVYTPRQIVDGYAPLLEAVLHNLGPDPSNTIPARKMLLDNMASILRADTRESSLNLPDASFDASRNEMRRQALKIGHTIVQYAAEVSEPQLDPKLNIRSPCEGHLLKQSVAQLMFGPRSQMHLMQLYNEWLHQMVLLRDALLPFDNYEEVIIPIEGTKLGLRQTEQTRSQFLLELLTKSITQKSVVTSAKALLAPRLSTSVGYGFQYEHGVILPAFLAGSPSLRLLHYFPVEVDATAKEVLFDYEFQDYYGAPRTEVSPRSGVLQENTWDAAALTAAEPNLRRAFLEVDQPGGPSTSTLLKLKLEFENDESASVDVGQISRGRRYSYRADEIEAGGNIDAKSGGTVGFTNASDVHPSTAVLSVTGQGLITTEKGGIHLIPTREAVLGLALLGKIFPENTILLSSGQSARKAETAGKTFANKPKFVIYCEDWKGIPKRGTGDEK